MSPAASESRIQQFGEVALSHKRLLERFGSRWMPGFTMRVP